MAYVIACNVRRGAGPGISLTGPVGNITITGPKTLVDAAGHHWYSPSPGVYLPNDTLLETL